MEEQRGLPFNPTSSHDVLRQGLPAFKHEALPLHPVQIALSEFQEQQKQTKESLLARAYGSALPLKMNIEQQILSRFQRPPGLLQSSMLGLESLTGELDELDFKDFLNNPNDSESLVAVDLHHGMEARLGLTKGPVAKAFF